MGTEHSGSLPGRIGSVEQLEEMLSEPSPRLVESVRRLPGDILVLGVAGKMGPTLARMARRAADLADGARQVIGVARFTEPALEKRLQSWGIETIRFDLLDFDRLNTLPDAPNVVFMAGMKFGSTGNEPLTWAMNTLLPAAVCQRYRDSRLAAFSTGNIYGLTSATGGGSRESDLPRPEGEYAMSCLGRERAVEYFANTGGPRSAILRLNYATEMRYGVLVDLARKVWNREAIDLAMGYVNVIWQGDANAAALQSLECAASPAFVVNLAGPEWLSVREVCRQFGELMGRPVEFVGQEAENALLSDGSLGRERFGPPRVNADQMIAWIADWVARGGESLGKPTHFEVRDGNF